jgi:hypothetical protein
MYFFYLIAILSISTIVALYIFIAKSYNYIYYFSIDKVNKFKCAIFINVVYIPNFYNLYKLL